jgi:hypothetical protein
VNPPPLPEMDALLAEYDRILAHNTRLVAEPGHEAEPSLPFPPAVVLARWQAQHGYLWGEVAGIDPAAPEQGYGGDSRTLRHLSRELFGALSEAIALAAQHPHPGWTERLLWLARKAEVVDTVRVIRVRTAAEGERR